jgi:hypothetical protein
MKHPISSFSVRLSEAGTSLLELMLALAAGLIVLGSVVQAAMLYQRQFSTQQAHVVRLQDLRLALEVLEQELRLAQPDSLSIVKPDEVEFRANVHGLMTTLTETALPGSMTLAVQDGRAWPERKTIVACWHDQCDSMTLARDGQRASLVVTQPISRTIPAGASLSIMNQVRYYSKRDQVGNLRLLRQIDGGASVLVADIEKLGFSYWDERGLSVGASGLIRRVVVEVRLRGVTTPTIREVCLRA